MVVWEGGGVVGSGTPGGQFQWSSWGVQVSVAEGGAGGVAAVVREGSGVVSSGTPGGQCQWSSCGVHVPVAVFTRVSVEDGTQCPAKC